MIDDSTKWKAFPTLLISREKGLSCLQLMGEDLVRVPLFRGEAILSGNTRREALGFTIKHLNLLFDSFNSVNNFNY